MSHKQYFYKCVAAVCIHSFFTPLLTVLWIKQNHGLLIYLFLWIMFCSRLYKKDDVCCDLYVNFSILSYLRRAGLSRVLHFFGLLLHPHQISSPGTVAQSSEPVCHCLVPHTVKHKQTDQHIYHYSTIKASTTNLTYYTGVIYCGAFVLKEKVNCHFIY